MKDKGEIPIEEKARKEYYEKDEKLLEQLLGLKTRKVNNQIRSLKRWIRYIQTSIWILNVLI